jgi:hypothetical protein
MRRELRWLSRQTISSAYSTPSKPQVAEPPHLLFVGVGNPLNLRGRQNVFQLAGAAVAEKPLGFFRTFEKARLLYNRPMVRLTSKF